MQASDDVWQRLDTIDPAQIKPGLGRIRAMLEALGDPQLAYPTAVVSGTNGKGSTAAMLAAIGRTAGHRVGCYTSPHLTRIEERFQVDGTPISRGGLAGQLEPVFSAVDRLMTEHRIEQPSYFEILTAAAFRYFAEARVELAILEVGLGGRWDATNVTHPRVVVITSIAIEHQEYLGGDLSTIAAEKSAVVPTAGLAVVAPQAAEAMESIRTHSEEVGSTLWEAERYPLVIRTPDPRLRYTIDCFGRLRGYVGLEVALPGLHQVENARCALLAAEALNRRRLRIGSDAVWAGLRSVRLPGRCEWLDGSPPILLDGAHNPAAARALAAYLTELQLRAVFDRLHLVFGVLGDKDAEGIAAALYPLADTLVVTQPPSPRARPASELLACGLPPATRNSELEPEAALARARQEAGPKDLICVTGSFYLVGALRPLLIDETNDA